MEEQKLEQALRASDLIVKYLKGDLTEKEQTELDSWIEQSDENRALFSELTNPVQLNQQLDELYKTDVKTAHAKLTRRLFPVRVMWRYAAAAAAIVILSIGGWYLSNSRTTNDDRPIFSQKAPSEILPGEKKARLVLGDGQVVELETKTDSSFNAEGGTLVTNSKGMVSYKGVAGNNELSYHTMIVPRGAEYQVWLDDGTKVWLNASSSLHYPTKFVGGERKVKLTGEGYFKVAENKSKPFHVSVNDLDVKVTGTEFNINAYNDEAIVKSTLFDGGIKITQNSFSFELKPGQQLQVDGKGNAKVVENADLEAAAAWKNGLFKLTSADIPTIMRQIARWYDLEVEYPLNFMPQIHITGFIPKNVNLDEVLEVLEASGVRFRLEGKKLILLP